MNGAKTPCPPNTYGASRGLTAATCTGPCLAEANSTATRAQRQVLVSPTFVDVSNTSGTLDCQCSPGTFRSSIPACEPCPSGYIQDSHGVSAKCTPCGSLQTSNAKNAMRCKQLKLYFSSLRSFVACAAAAHIRKRFEVRARQRPTEEKSLEQRNYF